MLERLAQESGIETPTAEDLARLDRKRKGKKLSNQDWVSRSDPEAKIAKMKDGTTHLAYKPEHAVDLDTGAVVAAELHPADEGDTTTLPPWRRPRQTSRCGADKIRANLTDKGPLTLVLKALGRPLEEPDLRPKQKGFARWHGDRLAGRSRTRLRGWPGKPSRSSSAAHNLDRGGMGTWLRERAQAIPAHVAGHNLSLLRQLIGAGTPKEAVAGGIGLVRAKIVHRLGGKPPSPRYASPWRETRSMTPFSTLIGLSSAVSSRKKHRHHVQRADPPHRGN